MASGVRPLTGSRLTALRILPNSRIRLFRAFFFTATRGFIVAPTVEMDLRSSKFTNNVRRNPLYVNNL